MSSHTGGTSAKSKSTKVPVAIATLCGSAMLVAAMFGSLSGSLTDFTASLLVEGGVALATITTFAALSSRILVAPKHDSHASGHAYGGPLHPRLRLRWLGLSISIGLAITGAAAGLYVVDPNAIFWAVTLELGVAIVILGILLVVEVLAVLGTIDPSYAPSRTGELCHRADPPSPVRFTPTLSGPVLECGHDPAHWYPALFADFPDLGWTMFVDAFLPGNPAATLRAWIGRIRRAVAHGPPDRS